jgi:hypothetical protein
VNHEPVYRIEMRFPLAYPQIVPEPHVRGVWFPAHTSDPDRNHITPSLATALLRLGFYRGLATLENVDVEYRIVTSDGSDEGWTELDEEFLKANADLPKNQA